MPGSSKRSGLSEGQADFVLFLLIIPEKEGGVNIRTPCLPASFCAILRKRRRLPGPDGGLCIRPSVKAGLTAVSEKGAGQEEKSGKGG